MMTVLEHKEHPFWFLSRLLWQIILRKFESHTGAKYQCNMSMLWPRGGECLIQSAANRCWRIEHFGCFNFWPCQWISRPDFKSWLSVVFGAARSWPFDLPLYVRLLPLLREPEFGNTVLFVTHKREDWGERREEQGWRVGAENNTAARRNKDQQIQSDWSNYSWIHATRAWSRNFQVLSLNALLDLL